MSTETTKKWGLIRFGSNYSHTAIAVPLEKLPFVLDEVELFSVSGYEDKPIQRYESMNADCVLSVEVLTQDQINVIKARKRLLEAKADEEVVIA